MFCPTRHCSCFIHANGPRSRWPKPAFPLCGWIVARTLVANTPSMSSHSSGLSHYYGGVHAPHETPTARRGNLSGLHDSLPVRSTAYSSRLCPASDKADQPGARRNRHSRETQWKHSQRPSIPNEAHRKDGRPNFDAQVSSTDSKPTASSSRIG